MIASDLNIPGAREPWTSGRLEGALDYADFHLSPASREGFAPDAAYLAFVEAVRYPNHEQGVGPGKLQDGRRGAHGAATASKIWGISDQEYLQKADVWPLNPQGEIFCILQVEDTRGVENLDDILANVPGIGCILIGEGDLSQELGYPRQYEHKVVLEWMKRVVDTCKKHSVVVGHPHVEHGNAERVVREGYRLLMCAPVQHFGHLEAARKHSGRG
jgi:4-hydroxy-2-oxoheptanedioate aldolase